ncbi:recombinase family protein [Aeromonas rivipollensis]|uniref:recombinase family protein n=1 Tax=Aeromonas rivipollensis TaxID=948519 RepID=UPI003D256719
MKPKAWLYARFSSVQQQDGDSINRQQQAAEKWCLAHDVELQQTRFADMGVSGFKSITRPMFEQLITAMSEGRIPSGSFVLFESTDRLSRQGWRHVQDLIRTITCVYGCKLVILDKGQIYTRENVDDVVQNMLLMFSADLAEKESERKSELVSAAYHAKRLNGDISRWPSWIDKTDHGFMFNDSVETIRLIVELRLKGVGALGISSELNRRGIPSPRGSIWNHTSIRVIIANSALYGTKDFYTSKSKKIQDDKGESSRISTMELVSSAPNVFPPICDIATWQAIQINGVAPGRKGEGTPFHNILYCNCGSAMGIHLGSAGERYRKCNKSKLSACKQKMIRNFDDTLLQGLATLTYESVNNTSRHNELLGLKDQLDKLEQVKSALIMSGDVNAIQDLYHDISHLKTKITEASLVIEIPSMELKDVFSGTIDEQRLALKRVVKRIEVNRVENMAHIRVSLTNGHVKSLGIRVGTGRKKSGINTIVFSGDSERFINEINSLEYHNPEFDF